jgi:hypothetical protein
VLLLVRDALPEWPTPYVFKNPVSLPEGTELALTGYVDSTDGATLPAELRTVISLTTVTQ